MWRVIWVWLSEFDDGAENGGVGGEHRVLDKGEDEGEYNLEMNLDGENESVESEMKPYFNIA